MATNKSNKAAEVLEMNLSQYAKKMKCAQSSISQRAAKVEAGDADKSTLPGVKSIRRLGRLYILEIQPGFDFTNAKKDFVGVKKLNKSKMKLSDRKKVPIKQGTYKKSSEESRPEKGS